LTTEVEPTPLQTN